MKSHNGLTALPLSNTAERAHSCTEALVPITTHLVKNVWVKPATGRPVNETSKKMRDLIACFKEHGRCRSDITIGIVAGDPTQYLVDGNNRCYAMCKALEDPDCTWTAIPTVVHYRYFPNVQERDIFYSTMQGQVSVATANDHLRALEASIPVMAQVKAACPWITYGRIRAAGNALICMSSVLFAWFDAKSPIAARATSKGAIELARSLTADDATGITQCLHLCHKQWFVPELGTYAALWSPMHITMIVMAYQRLVLGHHWEASTRPWRILTPAQFGASLSGMTTPDYRNHLPQQKITSELARREVFARVIAEMRSRLIACKVFTAAQLKGSLLPWNIRNISEEEF